MTPTPPDRNPWPSRLLRLTVTLAMLGAALWAGLRLWDHYQLAPWTRDGRVRASIVQIAPDVSGLVTAVPIQDNQRVAAGALLFEIDRARFALALRQADAALDAQRAALAQLQRESARNIELGNLISQELIEQSRAKVEQSKAAVSQAVVAQEVARLNLERAQVRAPTDGLVTNLDLRTGSYAMAGRPSLALVDPHSFYVEGYFEETKLPRIHVGDRVRVSSMAGTELMGTVDSLAAGIADRDRSTGSNLLPSVNPTFNWVRLAQRVPVRVRLDPRPTDAPLVAGETVTVQVLDGRAIQSACHRRPARPGRRAPQRARPGAADDGPLQRLSAGTGAARHAADHGLRFACAHGVGAARRLRDGRARLRAAATGGGQPGRGRCRLRAGGRVTLLERTVARALVAALSRPGARCPGAARPRAQHRPARGVGQPRARAGDRGSGR